ncbi:MAG: ComEC family competence protein [Firmicutes bacterium ADurb.Bin248]|nr:MAG: ComEC family competence protein [Firmicutes bacterium ADurb.Bin248]HPK15147.1 MBL fold metallo-hydrolase [Clostridia bacterium]
MLKLDFINVGDGDAILIRETGPGEADYVMLVDCGRPHIEFVPGSKRRHALNYLMREGIGRIDLMVLTHLHFDHIGGAPALLHHFPVGRLMALYLPPEGAKWVFAPESDEKTIIGMCDALNLFRDIVDIAREKGSACVEAKNGAEALTQRLKLTVYRPDDALALRQKEAFDALYLGKSPPRGELYAVSKERNCSSLIVRLEYAGRSMLLTGDSYADYWEGSGQERCDILKLPHHGDGKSMTEKLVKSLAPSYAVVSCQNDTSTKKERPSAEVIAAVQKHVPNVLCTENRELPTLSASMREAVRLAVGEDGVITGPRGI